MEVGTREGNGWSYRMIYTTRALVQHGLEEAYQRPVQPVTLRRAVSVDPALVPRVAQVCQQLTHLGDRVARETMLRQS